MASDGSKGGSIVTRKLNIEYDMTPVHPKDRDAVEAIIWTVATIESPMPKLNLVITPSAGVYNLVFTGIKKNLSMKNLHEVFFGDHRDHHLDAVDDVYGNFARGTFTVRVLQQGGRAQPKSIVKKRKRRLPTTERVDPMFAATE